MSFFFFYKIREQERKWEKDVGGWIQGKYCVHLYANRKMIPTETVSGMGRRWDKGKLKGRIWNQVWYSVRTFVNATMYPYPAQQ
jgi:hypothetical protein